mgnify:CR=1 FL=1
MRRIKNIFYFSNSLQLLFLSFAANIFQLLRSWLAYLSGNIDEIQFDIKLHLLIC